MLLIPLLQLGQAGAAIEVGGVAFLFLSPRRDRLAKTAAASLGGIPADEVEHVWHGLEPPYVELFAWLEGRGPRPEATDPAPFRPVMLSHPIEDGDFDKLDPAAFSAEWKWDGIRVQAVSGTREDGTRQTRLFSRTGEDIAEAFPDLAYEAA